MKYKNIMIRRFLCTAFAMALAFALCACYVNTGNEQPEQPAETSTPAKSEEVEEVPEVKEVKEAETAEPEEDMASENTDTEEKNIEMDEEMTGIYEALLTWEYNGFLASEYEDPEHIDWSEVFYLGQLAENEKYSESREAIEKAYAIGSEDIKMEIDDFGIDIFDGEVIREFIK